MSRNLDLHRRAANHAVRCLRARRLNARSVNHYVARLVTVGDVLIAIRAAVRRINRVAIHHPKKVYHYRYAQWGWGLHVHGKRREQPDYWALFAYDEDRAYVTCYVVPNAVVGRETLSVHMQDTPTVRGRSPLRAYEGAWHLIEGNA